LAAESIPNRNKKAAQVLSGCGVSWRAGLAG